MGSRQHRLVTRVDLNDTGREFLEASVRTDRSRRRRRVKQVIGIVALLAVIAATAGVGWMRATNAQHHAVSATLRAQATARQATAAQLLNEATDRLAQNRGDIGAIQNCCSPMPLMGT